MKIVIDSAIPFIEGVFERYACVEYVAGADISSATICDADAMIIRTRTKCNAALLDGSSVRHIATATIGYDHIDMEYCRNHNIEVTTAAGCNARGVLQWMAAALQHLSQQQGGWSPAQRRLGIVGVGNVGRLIEEYARLWGFDVVCCDPPRAEAEGDNKFIPLEELLKKCDIVTFHTPLNDTTYHMLDEARLKLLSPNAVVINTSRGEVIDSRVLNKFPDLTLMFDVWEGEPNIDAELMKRCAIATPHIAGYSIQGKANGTAAVVRDIARHFGLPIDDWYPAISHTQVRHIGWDELRTTIDSHFDIEALDGVLRSKREEFERLRNGYDYRQEYF